MRIKALRSLISKNMKMFFRSKISASAVVLIPLLIVILTGYAFDSSKLSNVNVGTYSSGYTEFTNGVISDFEQKGFSATRYETSEDCVNSIRRARSQICILFPANLNPDVNSEEIIFYADYSRVNLASQLISQIQSSIGVKTTNVSESLAQDLINSLQNIKASLPGTAEEINAAVDQVKKSRNIIGNIEFPSDEIDGAISDLEDVQSSITNDTSLTADIQSIIDDLSSLNESELQFNDDLGTIQSQQLDLQSTLTTVGQSIDNLVVAINSQRDISASNIVSPIKTKIQPVSTDSNSKNFIVPTMLALIALFGAVLLSSTMILREKKTKAFFRNYMAPVSNITFILSTYLSCLFILAIQFIFIIIGVEWVLDIHITQVLFPLSLALFASLSVFIGLGMLIGYLFQSEETTIFSAMIISSLLMFFSNAILPLENVSSGIMKILNFNPLVISSLAIKKVVLFGLGFSDILTDTLILMGIFIVFFIANTLLRKATRRIKQSA